MPRLDNWSADWIASHVLSKASITAARVVGDHLVELNAEKIPVPFIIATTSVDQLTRSDVIEVCQDNRVEFMVNIKADAIIHGEALEETNLRQIGIGGLGDLYSAVGRQELRTYTQSEAVFILRGLEQHTRVSSLIRLNNKLYQISRHGMPDITVLALHDYDMSSDVLRSGIKKYGRCDIVLAANPNTRISAACSEAAVSCGVRILKWGQLLGALNH